jgi:hypothetical protein
MNKGNVIMKKVVFSALAFFGLALPLMSFAEQGFVDDANVIGMMTTPGVYGGCMVQLSKPINGAAAGCPDDWVSFACTGTANNSVSRAAAMWDSATLAYALDKKIRVRVDSAKKLNGYCFADYIRINAQ